ncbi:PIG-U-domain-containing protein [Lentinula aciculospora]|uniref:PIG-U-domain-containing protein n=1 Tax=Lentinula aciculospora TaxID=153920 RepID=A0A9W9AX60_9AGAR|nr:PIG-U-domain-containing protein [Lentinula aciculospora]
MPSTWLTFRKSITLCIVLRVLFALGLDFYLSAPRFVGLAQDIELDIHDASLRSEIRSGSNPVVEFITTGPGLFSASSPLTSYMNLKECMWLYKKGIDPYGMGQIGLSPLYLSFSYLPSVTPSTTSTPTTSTLLRFLSTLLDILIWTTPDALSAWFLVRIWKMRSSSSSSFDESTESSVKSFGSLTKSSSASSDASSKTVSTSPTRSPKPTSTSYASSQSSSTSSIDALLPIICLLSPFQILPSLARSTSTWENAVLLGAVAFGSEVGAYQAIGEPTNAAAHEQTSAREERVCSRLGNEPSSKSKSLLLLALRIHLSLDAVILLPPMVMLILSSPRSRLTEPGGFEFGAFWKRAMATSLKTTQDSKAIPQSKSTSKIIYSVLLEFFVYWTILTLISTIIVGHWGWIGATWGASLSLPSLTPNPGVWWYFFTEMFDHFRPFFLVVFDVHLLMYVAPFCIKFQHDSLYALFLLTGVLATLKPYPTLSDHALFIALWGIFQEIFPYLTHPIPTILVLLPSSLLQPLFAHLWLTHGTGNANFYYASTLVGACAGGMAVVDAVKAGLRCALEKKKQNRATEMEDWEEEEREVVTQQ